MVGTETSILFMSYSTLKGPPYRTVTRGRTAVPMWTHSSFGMTMTKAFRDLSACLGETQRSRIWGLMHNRWQWCASPANLKSKSAWLCNKSSQVQVHSLKKLTKSSQVQGQFLKNLIKSSIQVRSKSSPFSIKIGLKSKSSPSPDLDLHIIVHITYWM